MPGTIDKVIVTNLGVLKAKYGSKYGLITKALDGLNAAYKARGLTSLVVGLGDAKAMKSLKAPLVTDPNSPKQNKNAIDGVYRALTPSYVVILGAIDVVPHQPLKDPVHGDGDKTVPSDLPYACEAPYSLKIAQFIGPTRVVGRIPDVTGGSDPAPLIRALATSAGYKSRSSNNYESYLGISADVWKKSTSLSLENTFGNSTDLKCSPPDGPNWTPQQIGSRSHFINCHGAPGDARFYGQSGTSYPVAHDAALVEGNLTEGTVCAPECCYGAQLYDPVKLSIRMGMCNTYLSNGAYAFFGSSTIAYGPDSGNDNADLIAQWFIQQVQTGASTGRAALQARQDYVLKAATLDPVDLKTLAQFNLMGDPAVHPVAIPVKPHFGASTAKSKKAMALLGADAERAARRDALVKNGLAIAKASNCIGSVVKKTVSSRIAKQMRQLLGARLLANPEMTTFSVDIPKPMLPKGARLAKSAFTTPTKVHLVVAEINHSRRRLFKKYVAIVAHELDGTVVLHRYVSR